MTFKIQEINANPPSNVVASFTFATKELSITVTHPTTTPSSHYINEIEIYCNNLLNTTLTYTSQPSDTFTVSHIINAKNNDVLKVIAYCSLFGSGEGQISVIDPGSTSHPATSIDLKYNFLDQLLNISIMHTTIDPMTHFIQTIEIHRNNQWVTTLNYSSQPTTNSFTVLHLINASNNMVIKVNATCTQLQSTVRELIVKDPSINQTTNLNHPTTTLILNYNFLLQSINITITHFTNDSTLHFIQIIEIYRNNLLNHTLYYFNQPSENPFSILYMIKANNNDTIKVNATCTQNQSTIAEIEVKNSDLDDTFQIDGLSYDIILGLNFMVITYLLFYLKKKINRFHGF